MLADFALARHRRLFCERYLTLPGVQVTVEPESLQNAKTLIASRYPDVRCEVLSNQILRLYEKINPADLNQFLVENKVRVCGLGANDEDIERFFVEKLSGGHAV